jgi:hypothetical protein
MARRNTGRMGLIIFGVAGALLLALGGWFIVADANKAAEAERAAAASPPTLPQGRFKLVKAGMTEARYLALDTLKPGADGGLEAVILVVGRTATSLEGGTALMIKREVIDCAGQRLFEGQIGYFDVDGALKAATTAYAGKRGRPFEPGDTETAIACDPAKQTGRIVNGWREAQRELQTPPEGYAKALESRPQDADGWAWLCASAARRNWRAQSPADCERALALRPADRALRVDRGFLNLTIGRNAAADADFRRAMSEAPEDAGALFGHSLVLAMKGDKAGSRAVRIKALDIDPDVPEWIERSFRFFITPEFRGR